MTLITSDINSQAHLPLSLHPLSLFSTFFVLALLTFYLSSLIYSPSYTPSFYFTKNFILYNLHSYA